VQVGNASHYQSENISDKDAFRAANTTDSSRLANDQHYLSMLFHGLD